MIHTTHYISPIGNLLLAECDEKLIGLWTEGQKYYFNVPADAVTEKETPILTLSKSWLDQYFAGENPKIHTLALSPVGSAFRQTVWNILCEIPYGQVTTYGEIAKKLTDPAGKAVMSARAIGGAVGHNPISIIIPCHRVVGANGSLTGYAGGIEAKKKLLSHEGVNVTQFSVPK